MRQSIIDGNAALQERERHKQRPFGTIVADVLRELLALTR
jgi:hypothetical protein